MDFRHLRYFIGVAEQLNFSKAAKLLNVSQPPLTQAIRQLEEELGGRLFERTSRKVELTEAGTFFLSRARSILAQVNRTTLELQSGNQGRREVLRVGLTRTMSILPEALKNYRARFPNVHLELISSVKRKAHDFLIDDEADINLGEYVPPDADIDSRLWAELRLLAVFSASHPFANRDSIRIRELRDYPLLLPELTSSMNLNSETLRFCRETGRFEPRLLQHCDDVDVLLSLISSGAGVGILHGLFLNNKPKDLMNAPFRERTPSLKTGIAWRKDRVCPALVGLIEELEAAIRPMAKDIPGSVYYEKHFICA